MTQRDSSSVVLATSRHSFPHGFTIVRYNPLLAGSVDGWCIYENQYFALLLHLPEENITDSVEGLSNVYRSVSGPSKVR